MNIIFGDGEIVKLQQNINGLTRKPIAHKVQFITCGEAEM